MTTVKNKDAKNQTQNKNGSNSLWAYRKKRGLSQKQVAYLMGHKSTAHISHYERGEKLPSLQNALKLEAVLGGVFVSFLYPELFSRIRQEVHTRREALNRSQPFA